MASYKSYINEASKLNVFIAGSKTKYLAILENLHKAEEYRINTCKSIMSKSFNILEEKASDQFSAYSVK